MSFTIFKNEKTPFYAIKTESLKNRKFDIFPYSRTDKTPFYAIKTRSSKSGKIHIFPKGLTHGFGPKMAIFPTFFLGI